MEGSVHPFDVRSEVVVERFCGQSRAWPFGNLERGSYQLIMIDPPWPTTMRSQKGERKSAAHHYRSMPFADIAALPVGELAAPHSFLFMWCTWPLLLEGGDPKRHYKGADASYSPVGACLHAYGFRYATGGAWHKKTVRGKTAFGPGYRFRSACEPFLLGVRGKPKNSRSERNLFDGLRREHSRKPEEAYAMLERWMPGARRVELFSQTPRPGWDSWGDQAAKYEAAL